MSFYEALAAESPSMLAALEAESPSMSQALEVGLAYGLEVAYREADTAAFAAARVYREAGYPGFESESGRAYMGACRRLEEASSARYARRVGSC